MKRGILLITIILVLSVPMLSFGQSIGFGVKVGGHMLQTMQFMLPMGNIQPFIGVDFLGVSLNTETSALGSIPGTETEISGSLLIPHIGLKFFMGTGDAKPYFFGNFFKSFASVKAETDGTSMLGEETEDLIKDFLGFWGVKLGFGGEYAISDAFSVGGEWGFHLLKAGATQETDVGMEQALETDIKAALKNSYVAFVLNFYF